MCLSVWRLSLSLCFFVFFLFYVLYKLAVYCLLWIASHFIFWDLSQLTLWCGLLPIVEGFMVTCRCLICFDVLVMMDGCFIENYTTPLFHCNHKHLYSISYLNNKLVCMCFLFHIS